MTGRIHSTESFGTVDGPGIRFVVFFQGCPMRCLYCHNPDTWAASGGTEMTADTLLTLFERKREFYRNGGITATGGEPMAQLAFLTELFTKAKQRGIHTCLDTSGICYDPGHPEQAAPLLAVTDLVMLDIKHIDDERHKALTGQSNARILAFARRLSEEGTALWIRHVIVPGWTDDEEALLRLGRFLGGLRTLKALDCLPYHTMGKSKYEELGIPYPLGNTEALSPEDAAAARNTILRGIRQRLREEAGG
ncbi:MAG: pyruvate formate lyase-activating protein [Oscillospiraceae bacterium]|nr:pyruvate formate lyase-activating protein [Oscillospiraceae bacterium]